MPEAAAAAPVATPAVNTTQPAQTQTPAPDANAWTDDDSKGFEALLKKRGLKVKANGEEKAISSLDDLMKEFEFSSKGRGAAKVASEAKREAEEARAAKAEAARLKQLHEAAKAGDYEARLELGLVSQSEQQERQSADESLPPEARALKEAYEASQRELTELRAEKERTAKEAEQRKLETHKAEVRKQATAYVTKVLDAAGLDLKADAEEARPFLSATYQAMREFADHGLDLAADTTAELVVRRVAELRSEASEKSFGKLKPERRLKLAVPVLEQMAAEVFGTVGPDGKATGGSGDVKRIVEAVGLKTAKAIARAVAQMQRTAKAAPVVAQPGEAKKEEPPKRQPLPFGTPFWGNR